MSVTMSSIHCVHEKYLHLLIIKLYKCYLKKQFLIKSPETYRVIKVYAINYEVYLVSHAS